MNEQQRNTKSAKSTKGVNTRQGKEMLLFLIFSVVGIYAFGNGLTGLFEPGKGIDLLWLAVAVGVMMVLFSQMGRVHDTWPRRRDSREQHVEPPSQEESAQPIVALSEERKG